MESNQYQKVVTISYLAVAALISFLLLAALMKVSNMFDLESKVKSIEYIIRFGSLGIGAITFLVLLKNQKVNEFMNEVAIELMTKVSWPTSKETWSATVIVIVTVVVAGIFLWLFDMLWVYALKAVL